MKPKHAITVVGKNIPADEPLFLLRAQDVIAPGVVEAYAHRLILCADELDADQGDLAARLRQQAEDVKAVAMRFRRWQIENPDRTKVPD